MIELDKFEINVDDALRDIENFLRDNIKFILKNKYGEQWKEKLGISESRINIWNNRREEEKKRMNGKELEESLLYYSDFYDLHTIINKNWNLFKDVFENKKEIEYQLNLLESFRNPNAHNRDLLNHQKHLLLGICGEIKLCIMKYKGDTDNVNTYFPDIEAININGKIIKQPSNNEIKAPLRRGDVLEITIYTSVPPNQKVYYALWEHGKKEITWKEDNKFLMRIDDSDEIGENSCMIIVKSNQNIHRINSFPESDARCLINYIVLP